MLFGASRTPPSHRRVRPLLFHSTWSRKTRPYRRISRGGGKLRLRSQCGVRPMVLRELDLLVPAVGVRSRLLSPILQRALSSSTPQISCSIRLLALFRLIIIMLDRCCGNNLVTCQSIRLSGMASRGNSGGKLHGHAFCSASALSSQYVIPISRYIDVAAVRWAWACSRCPVPR